MANTKISALPAASALSGSEILPAVQGGADVALTPKQILAAKLSGLQQIQELSPAATTQTTLTNAGYGAGTTFAPQTSGRVLVIFTCNWQVSASVGGQLSSTLCYNTGTAPPAGQNPALGTTFGLAQGGRATTTNVNTPLSLFGVLSLNAGTTYWFDLQFATSGASDQITIEQGQFIFVEL